MRRFSPMTLICIDCKKPYERKSYCQKRCGSPKEKGTCSYAHKNSYSVKRKYQAAYYQKPGFKYYSYRKEARLRSHVFELTFEQFMSYWQKSCFYCGDSIVTVGLDRVDNLKGYTLDNIVPCCAICNKMKRDLQKDDFFQRCKRIAILQGMV